MKKIVFIFLCLLFFGMCTSAEANGPAKLGRNIFHGITPNHSAPITLGSGTHCDTPNCTQCNALGQCTACAAGFYLQGGKCKTDQCAPGVWHPLLGHCVSKGCSNCASCVDSNYCENCNNGYLLNDNGQCQAKCSAVVNCDVCPSAPACTKCSNGYEWNAGAGACVSTCDPGFVYHPMLGKCVSQGCSSGCSTGCVGELYCTECDEGYKLNNSGLCVSVCDEDEEWSNGTCHTACLEGQVYNPEVRDCVTSGAGCDANCTNCINGKYCTACATGYNLGSDGICASKCVTGKIWNETDQHCYPVCANNKVYNPVVENCVPAGGSGDINCTNPHIDGDYCAACAPGYELSFETGACVSLCADKYTWNEEDQTCYPSCNPGYVYNKVIEKCVAATCVANCSDDCPNGYCAGCLSGYYLSYDDGTCPSCSSKWPSCGTCSYNKSKGVRQLRCTSCADGYVQCRDLCNDKEEDYVQNGGLWCYPQCTNKSLTHCEICDGNTCMQCAEGYVVVDKQCVLENSVCPPGKYKQAGVCKLCPAGTYQPNYGATSCTPCPLGTYQPNSGATSSSACLSCAAGYYTPRDLQGGNWTGAAQCTACPEGCSACNNAIGQVECTACFGGYHIPVGGRLCIGGQGDDEIGIEGR